MDEVHGLSEPEGNFEQRLSLDEQLKADEAAREAPEQEADAETPSKSEPKSEPSDEDISDNDEKQEPDETEKRISKLAYEKRRAEKAARDLQRRLDQLEGKIEISPDEQTQEMIRREAGRMAALERGEQVGRRIREDGMKDFPDFANQMAKFNDYDGPNSYGITDDLVEAAEAAGDSHKILHYLARNLDKFDEIRHLKPHQMGAALGKIAAEMNRPAPRQQSKAPAPIKPVGGSARAETTTENMSMEDFVKMEDEKYQNKRYRY